MKQTHHIWVVMAVVIAAMTIGFGCSHKQDIAPIPELGTAGPETPLIQGEELPPPTLGDFTVTDVKLILPNGEEVGLDSKRINRFSKIKVTYDGEIGDAEPRLQPYVKLVVDSEEQGVITYKHSMPYHHLMTHKLIFGGNEYYFVAGSPGDVNGDGFSDVLETIYVQYPSEGQRVVAVVNLMFGGLTSVTSMASFNYLENPAAQFGAAMTLSDVNGDGYADVIIGAPLAEAGKGCVYVFHGGSRDKFPEQPFPIGVGMLATDADTTICSDDSAPALFGGKIAAGDIDGDGFGDVIVGAPFKTDSGPPPDQHVQNQFAGGVYVFKGSSNGLGAGTRNVSDMRTGDTGPLDYVLHSNRQRSYLGWSVAAADIDADGKDEIVAGAPGTDADSNANLPCVPGKAYIVPGDVAQADAFINTVGQELAGPGCGANGEKDSFGYIVTPARIVLHIHPYMDAVIIGAKDKTYRYIDGLTQSPKFAPWFHFPGTKTIVELWPSNVGFAVPDQNYVQRCVGADNCIGFRLVNGETVPAYFTEGPSEGELIPPGRTYPPDSSVGGPEKFGTTVSPTGNHIGGTFSFAIGAFDQTVEYDDNGTMVTVKGGATYAYGYNRAENKFGYQLRVGGAPITSLPGTYLRIGGNVVGGRIR